MNVMWKSLLVLSFLSVMATSWANDQKLTIESLMLDGVNRGGIIHSQFSQELNDSLLNHNDASALPLVFHESCYLLWIRPYRHLDFLKNAI